MTTNKEFNPTELLALASDPAVEPAGSIYYNTTLGVVRKSDGASWSTVGGSSGTQRTYAFFIS